MASDNIHRRPRRYYHHLRPNQHALPEFFSLAYLGTRRPSTKGACVAPAKGAPRTNPKRPEEGQEEQQQARDES